MSVKVHQIHNNFIQDEPSHFGTTRMVSEDDYLEVLQQNSALQTSQDNIINGLGIKGDGPYSKLVLEKFILLAGEVDAYRALVDNLGVIHSLKAPETDNLLAYYKAQGVDEFLNDEFVQEVAMRLADFNGETEETVNTVVWSGMPPEPEGNVWELEYVSRASFLLRKLKEFAANRRKEVKDKELMDVIDSMGGNGNKAARRAANLRAGRKG